MLVELDIETSEVPVAETDAELELTTRVEGVDDEGRVPIRAVEVEEGVELTPDWNVVEATVHTTNKLELSFIGVEEVVVSDVLVAAVIEEDVTTEMDVTAAEVEDTVVE